MKESFLIDVLKKGVSPFHCVEAAMETLEESGFEELEYARHIQIIHICGSNQMRIL